MGSHLNNQQNNTCYNASKKKKVRVLYRLMPPFYKRKKTHCANVTVSFETPIVYQFPADLLFAIMQAEYVISNQGFHRTWRDFQTYVVVLEVFLLGNSIYRGRHASHEALVYSRSIGNKRRRPTSFSHRLLVKLHGYRATIRGSK